MSASVKPISTPSADDRRQAIDGAVAKIRQARAISDLMSVADAETLFDETLGWANSAICDLLEEAADTVEQHAREGQS